MIVDKWYQKSHFEAVAWPDPVLHRSGTWSGPTRLERLPCVKVEIILYMSLCHLRYCNSLRSSPGWRSPQALNLVPSGFWSHRLKYVFNSAWNGY